MKPLFTLGHVVATPGALAAIGVSGDDLSTYLARHQSGDWGDVDAHDRKENQLSLEQGLSIRLVCPFYNNRFHFRFVKVCATLDRLASQRG